MTKLASRSDRRGAMDAQALPPKATLKITADIHARDSADLSPYGWGDDSAAARP